MYYKKGSFTNIRCIEEFENKYENEFTLALYEKYREVYGNKVKIGSLNITNNNITINKIVVVLDPEFISTVQPYKNDFRIESLRKIGQFKSLESNSMFGTKIDSFKEIEANGESIKELCGDFSNSHYELAKNELANFYNVSKKGLLYDKNQNEYDYVVIENSDNGIGSTVLIDEVNVLKDGILLGYIKIKYGNLEIEEECKKIPYSVLNKKKFTKDEKESYLKLSKIEYNENNIDILFKILQTETKDKLNKYNEDHTRKIFHNIATVDYSKVADNIQGQEIGKEMYLIMGKHLKEKGIKFRSSSLQSDSAISLWHKFKEKMPEIIKEETISGEKFLIMDIPDGLDLRNKHKKNRILKNSSH